MVTVLLLSDHSLSYRYYRTKPTTTTLYLFLQYFELNNLITKSFFLYNINYSFFYSIVI